ncbi:MAG: type I-E CRISPR-associated protein Cas6/Cse3/CasE [Candidatus Omnitrophica bacterium]|nr:type I-E CRISPR-associated protein Cas6/Cse3/CasE [Candidatus Omnitrophota bacterium]
MFISKMILSGGSRRKDKFWQIFDNEYALHQAVWDLFGDRPDRERDFLYRLETIGKWPVVYAVSERRPADSSELWDMETKEYDPKVKADVRLGFTVRVNPTRKRDGKRHDVVMDWKYKSRSGDAGEEKKRLLAELVAETCTNWLKERGENNGFETLSLRADGYRQNRFIKKKSGLPVRYSTVDFTGTLKVRDEQRFKKMLFEGLGPEKGFGCGLMLVRRI